MGTPMPVLPACPHPLVLGDSLVTVDIFTEDDTVALAAKLSKILHAGDVVALWGNLGAGKSAFCRGVIRALTSPDEEVPSPTFTLVQVYEPEQTAPIWHFDLYRLEDPDEVWELGLEDARDEAISLIEWPSRMGRLLPIHRLDVVIDFHAADPTADTSRQVQLIGRGPSWGLRLAKLEDTE